MILCVSMLVSLFDEYWLGFKCRMVEATLEEGEATFLRCPFPLVKHSPMALFCWGRWVGAPSDYNGCVIRSG